ncbi:OmpA family protein [Pseudoduganella sp. R-34]|uniref:OmpA family protein n=1 Tax=Pseudoduganella sp. R-34 TaxID=3404062 RepID=UPI003CE92C17
MKPMRIVSMVSAAALIASCATEPPVQSIEYNYKVENATASGIVQVFEMTGNTVVQIRGIEYKSPVFLDENRSEIKFRILGQTAVLTGTYRSFTVMSGASSSKVTRIGNVQAMTTTASAARVQPVDRAVSAAQPAGASDEEMRAQLASMKAELASLRKLLASAQAHETAQPAQQRYAEVTSSRPVSSVSIQFKDNSTSFEPKPALASTIMDLSKDASEISITGYTDSSKASPASARLAKERAAAAGKYLVSRGVDQKKITLSFRPSGGFIAENSSKEGKERNRRVEIDII